MADWKTLKTEKQGNVLILTINRPEALNALNLLVYKEINEVLDEIDQDTDVKVLIITGEGKAFVAGADIAEMSGMDPEQGYKFSKTGQDTFDRIESLDIPVIAAVNGFALGGGCEFAMACDFRIASSKAKFGQPEMNLGLIPGYAGTQRLSRLAGLGNALYLILTAEMITAEEALRMGLVQRVVEPEQLMETTLAMALKIAANGSSAALRAKRTIKNGYNMDFAMACDMEAQEFSALFGEDESQEGMKAFLEKRKPEW
ncbi:MAG: enoyl-CoA hydratase/isomerase family protein [Bacteroidales bacterium]